MDVNLVVVGVKEANGTQNEFFLGLGKDLHLRLGEGPNPIILHDQNS